ncbi:hypothetical protein [Reyranella sp.]|jgi:hypothetical protein|uniref:hypothetical protein n=1 Tax=Reyranella sp. TaxID=1929291 RepID=UPI002F928FD9
MLYELKAARLEPLQSSRDERRPGLFTHLGSSVALVLGFFGLFGELGSEFKGAEPSGMMVGAPIMILGALAYRSAKKRALGEVASGPARWLFEGATILLILFLLAAQPNVSTLMATDPGPYFVIPLWALTAYLVAAAKAMVRRRR